MAITETQIELFLAEIRGGATAKAAAATSQIHRPRLYDLRKQRPQFAAAWAIAKQHHERMPELPSPVGAEMTAAQATAFAKAVIKSRRVNQAALEARVDLYPRRVKPSDLTTYQRSKVRAMLDSLRITRTEEMTPQELARHCFDKWLAGSGWDDSLGIDLVELGKLSARAAADFERHLMLRAAESAAASQDETPPE